jgi:hypothetical protein
MVSKGSYKSDRVFFELEDFNESIFVSLEDEGDRKLSKICEVASYRLSDQKLAAIKRYFREESQMIPLNSLKSLFEVYDMSGERKSAIVRNISEIKAGHNGSKIEVDGIPIHLSSPDWGFIFGMLPDLRLDSCEGFFKDRKLAENLFRSLENVGLSPNKTEASDGVRVRGKAICGKIVEGCGFGTEERQVEQNICFPNWVYEVDNKDFHRALMAGIIESEGSAPTDSTRTCRFTQATELKGFSFPNQNIESESTPTGHDVERIYFNDLSDQERKSVMESPPPLLKSVKRLVEMYDISSKLRPESVYRTERTTAALWNLSVSGEDIRKLYQFCGKYLVSKDNQFESYFEQKQEDHRDKGTRLESYLRDVEELYDKNGYVTSKMLAEHADRAEKTAVNTLSILKNKGLIECDGFENQYKCWKPV